MAIDSPITVASSARPFLRCGETQYGFANAQNAAQKAVRNPVFFMRTSGMT